jgi:hypothetical protein
VGVTRVLSVAVFALVLLAFARPALAREDARTEKAREHAAQADAYYKLDKLKEALGEYEQAYLSKPDPSFLFNIAQCHRLMGNKREAIKFFKRFLKDRPESANRGGAEKHIRELEAQLAAETPAAAPIAAPAPAPVATPAHPTAAAPAAAPVVAPVAAPVLAPAPAAALGGAQAAALQMPPPELSVPPAREAPGMPQPGAAAGTGTNLALAAPPPAADVARGADPIAPPVPPRRDDDAGPVFTRWWFWTAVGAGVAGLVAVSLLASRGSDCETGRVCK